jgi:ABC-type Fe3+-hydroxamate transport system substrate-binding protein
MKMNRLVALFIIAIIVSPNLTIVRGQTLTLVPFDVEYESGEDVSISGTATADANLTLVVVFNTTPMYEANFTAEGDGNYSEEYEIPDNATEGVYTVTVSDGGESVDADFTVASDDSIVSDDSRELAETIIEQAEDLKDNVEDAFDDLEDVEVPSGANSSYLQGIDYLNMAKESFDAGNYTEASDMAFNAIQSLGYALEEALKLQPEVELTATVENDESENEDAQGFSGLLVALERANRYWDKLNATVTRLEESGDDVSRIRDLLDEANIVLDESVGHVAEGNFTAAREDFTRARKVLGRINGLLNSSTMARREKQAEKFLEQFQKRVEKISGTVMGLQGNLAASKTGKVKAVLNSTAETLFNISGGLSGGNMTDVLDDLDDVVEELDDGLDELNGEGLSKQIKSVYRFMAKIDSLNRSLQRLANAGYNTSGLDEYLSEAKSLLIQSEEKIREGNETEAEKLIEEA